MPTPDDILFRNPSAAFDEDRARHHINSDPNIARGYLHTALATIQDNVNTAFNADTAVQIAGIWQLEARTHVLEAMRSKLALSPIDKARSFSRAANSLHGHALGQTTPYVSGKEDPRFTGISGSPHNRMYETKLGEVYDAHATTLSMLARIARARELVLGEVTAETTAHRSRYSDAHFFALNGNHATTLIKNALFAARDARSEEDNEESKENSRWWFKRATSGLLWALRNDPSNFTTGFNLIRRERVALRSAEAARAAILAGA